MNNPDQTSLFTAKGYLHGGKRPGSGRKKTENPRKAHTFSCTEEEAKTLKALLEFMRSGEPITEINLNSIINK